MRTLVYAIMGAGLWSSVGAAEYLDYVPYAKLSAVQLRSVAKALARSKDEKERVLAADLVGLYPFNFDGGTVSQILPELLADREPTVRLEALSAVEQRVMCGDLYERDAIQTMERVLPAVRKLARQAKVTSSPDRKYISDTLDSLRREIRAKRARAKRSGR